MREAMIDAARCTDRESLHDILASTLALPEHYGRTLDALYDMLTDCPPTRLTLVNALSLIDQLGTYGELVLRVLADASGENPEFILNTDA